jgi:hypothetical protein
VFPELAACAVRPPVRCRECWPFVAGAGLLTAPWWSSTLTTSDYPLVVVLGSVFASIGAFAALPDRWPRLRQLAFMLFMATFGLVCAALLFTPFHPDSDGTYRIGGIPGFVASEAMPWWARIVAGIFTIVCLGAAALSAWGLVRDTTSRDVGDGDS